MLRITFCVLALALAPLSYASQPVIENERVTIWDTTAAMTAQHDFVTIALTDKAHAVYGRKGEVAGKDGVRTVVIELKDLAVAPIANGSGLPLAFPRPHVRKLLENERIIVWDYRWRPGEATPMHFHDKDAIPVYLTGGTLQSTTPDGKSTVNDFKNGEIRFNKRDRAHSELLVSGNPHAVITELK
jgi:hypothetical protein